MVSSHSMSSDTFQYTLFAKGTQQEINSVRKFSGATNTYRRRTKTLVEACRNGPALELPDIHANVFTNALLTHYYNKLIEESPPGASLRVRFRCIHCGFPPKFATQWRRRL